MLITLSFWHGIVECMCYTNVHTRHAVKRLQIMQEGYISQANHAPRNGNHLFDGGTSFSEVSHKAVRQICTPILSVFFLLFSSAALAQTVPGPPQLNFGEPTSVSSSSPASAPVVNGSSSQAPILFQAHGDHRVYEIVGERRHWIPSQDAFASYGFRWDQVKKVSSSERDIFSRLNLVRQSGGQQVYYITESGLKRHIPSAEVFLSYGNQWNAILDVSSEEINSYRTNDLVQMNGDSKVYRLEGEDGAKTKRWIPTAQRFNELGLRWDEIAVINQIELDSYSTGESL